jgi:hypothetical protein
MSRMVRLLRRERSGLALFVVIGLVAGLSLGVLGCRPQLAGGDAGLGGAGGTDGAPTGTGQPPPSTPEQPTTAACPLCGVETKKADLLHRPLAVILDNHSLARPQSGLDDACLVYEVLTEGGITRFVAFFLHNDTAAIGPVRSLRPYFLDLAMPLGAPIAHSGGSPRAIDDSLTLKPSSMSIDEMVLSRAFWRVAARTSPHNCYTSLSALRAASVSVSYEGKSLSATTPTAFNFAPAADKVAFPSSSQPSRRLTLSYEGGADNYAVTFDYDPATGQWMRYLTGSAQIDAATGRQLRATTVIVQYVSSWVVPGDAEGRLELALTGSGAAKVFSLGRVFGATWSKPSRTARLAYSDASGNPLTLPPGPVWVLIAPPGSRLDWQ